jgi:uncharacterized repeat protein (TIGR01451 family)
MLRGITILSLRAYHVLLSAAGFIVFTAFLFIFPSFYQPVSAQAFIEITKTASPEPVYTGNTLTYTITITNVGDGPATNVVVYDTITAFENPVYRIGLFGGWNEWHGQHDFETVLHVIPNNTRTIQIRGLIGIDQCDDVSNKAFVTYFAGSDSLSASASILSTVIDNQLPVITCPEDIAQQAMAGECFAILSITPATAIDNCDIASIVGSRSDGLDIDDPYPVGTTTITWTATDFNWNTSNCNQQIVITDDEDPTIDCIGDQTVNCDFASCAYTHTNDTWDATGDDNCTVFSFEFELTGATTGSGTTLNGVNFNLGTTTVTWTVTDGSGNTADCSFTITVQDTENPTITCAADQTRDNDTGLCTYTAVGNEFDPTFYGDNCTGSTITNDFNGLSTLAGAVFPLGTTTVTWTVTDGSGNTADCSFTITVQDTENPTITCAADQTRDNDAGLCTYTAVGNEFDPTFYGDNCTGSTITNDFNGLSTLAGAVFPLGTTTVTWTVTDGSGNTADCSFTITVQDTENPTITCAADQTRDNDTGLCTYTAVGNEFDPTFYGDNCTGSTITNDFNGLSTLAGAVFPLGTTTVTWTVTDGSGNTADCSFTITVQDTENPTITCAADQTRDNDAGLCTYTAVGNEFDPTFYGDNCTGSTITNDFNGLSTLAGAVFPLGTTTVTWTVTDGSGNTADCSFTITVQDTENPTITCAADQTRDNDTGLCTYTAVGNEFDPTFYGDNCTGSTITNDFNGLSTLAGAVFPLGTTTVTWTVTDGSGNTADCSFTITVQDTENPTITCAADQTRDNDTGLCTYTAVGNEFDPTFYGDNCTGSTITNDFNGLSTLAGAVFPLGTTTVTWTVTDGSGNTADCSFTITVQDTENPTITCAADQTRDNDAGLCTYTAVGNEFDPTFYGDNCTGSTITNDFNGLSTLAGAVFPLGTTTVTWTVTDGSGNTADCSFTITVQDTENPTITCAADQTRDNDAGLCTYTAVGNEFDPTFYGDNCTGSTITNDFNGLSTLAGAVFPLGTTTVTWTVTDGSGNTADCSFTITVQDTENPTITCAADQTRDNDAGLCTYTAVGNEFDPTFYGDNCTGSTITNDFNGLSTLAGAVFPLGTTTVTWTVTDGSGNTADCSFTITVQDTENPTITCAADQTRDNDTGLCTYTAVGNEFDPTFYGDNCTGSTITNDFNGLSTLAGAVFPLGTTTVTWTVTDGSGNTADCSFTITVQDTENPTITCAADQTRDNDTGLCTYTAVGNEFDPTFYGDNCTGSTITNDFNGLSTLAGAVFPLGTTTVTWTVTDGSGNTADCSFTITVQDTENPTITCAADQTRDNDAGLCTYTAVGNEFDPTFYGDNCTGSTITNDFNGLSTLAGAVFPLGTTTVTWTVTDGSGNTADCSFMVTVEDNEAPVINCVGNQTVNADAGVCTYTHSGIGWDATGSDNCNVASLIYELSGSSSGSGTTLNGVIFNSGNTIVTWTITDNSGNTSTCSYTVTVVDTEIPTIVCPGDQVRSTNLNVCSYTVVGNEFDPVVFDDNCPGETISNNLNGLPSLAGMVLPLGVTTVVWTVTDAAGNTANCSFTITIEDNQAPVINCPPSFSRNVNAASCHATIQAFYLAVTFSDNCTVTAANISWVLSGVTSGSGTGLMPNTIFNVGVTTVTYTITDNSGITSQCSFNVTVIDNILPTIMITNKVRYNDPGQCYYTVIGNEFQPTFNDNCPGATIQNNYNFSNTLAGATFPVGVTSVIWTVTDVSGNTATRTFTVTVTDNEPPVIFCPPSFNVPCPDGVPAPDSTLVTAFDNCGIVTVYHHNDEYHGLGWSPGFCPDSITRTYRAVDAAGNVTFCSHVIRVDESCGCEICQSDVPHFWIDMTGKCDSTWISPSIRREGLCCDATWPERCISFSVMLDEYSIGFYVDIIAGATPGGWYYQVDCGEIHSQASILCDMPTGVYHTITICKPGNNPNTYMIKSLCGLISFDEIYAQVDCNNEITLAGVPSNTVQWYDITGDYLHYLDPPSGSLTTIFRPDSLAPTFIQYLVCGGLPDNPCAIGGIVCDTVDIWVVPRPSVAIDPPYPQFCEYDPKIIYADVWPIGFYEFHWLDSLGNVIETGLEFVPPGPGHYAIAAYDTVSPFPCPYDTLFFEVIFQQCILQCPTQYHCEEDDILIYLTLEDFLAAGAVLDFPCGIPNTSINVVGEPWSNGLSCPETIVYTYMIVDSCGNTDICDVLVYLGDTIPPTFTLPSDTVYCVEDIINALYNPVGVYPIDDLTYPRPDYFLLTVGNTILDILNLDDNCMAPEDLVITWELDFGINGTIDQAGTGLLSGPPPIYFPVGTNAIYYTVTDECGNSNTQTLIIVVDPRPDIQDDF